MQPARDITLAEYLALEEASPTKNELVNGQIVAMAGASLRHNTIATNLIGALVNALKGSDCRPIVSDQRVHVVETDLDTYPDVSVVCGDAVLSPTDRHAIVNPTVLFEVLSPSTEGYDRGAKWQHYQRIPTLREYVLIAGFGEPAIERFRRMTHGTWSYELARGAGASVALASCPATLDIAELYAAAPEE